MAENKEQISIPFIEGSLVNLCPPNTENIKLYTKWMNSPVTRRFARYEIPQTIEEVKKLFEPTEERVRNEIFFEIWHIEDEKPIGYTGITRINWFDRHGFVFYMIGEPNYWGKNIATEAGKLVLEYGFNELNLHKITATVFAPNKASIRVAEKIGLTHEITLQKEVYIEGNHVDSLKYSLLKRDWTETNTKR
ncbi:MAG: GNAT family N-acetyltransferase [Promethearchaeota archaeon]|jgi:RimJ/RimL family protein N-acetyltransferase